MFVKGKVKRLLLLILTALLVFSLIACTTTNPPVPTATATATTAPEATMEATMEATPEATAESTAEATPESVTEPVDISIWVPIGRFSDVDRQTEISRDKDYGLVEKKLNIRLKYVTVPAEQARDQLGIMLSTNSMPDIIAMPGAYDTFLISPDQLFADGQIIDLKSVEANIPDYMKIVNENPVIMKNVMDDENHILYFGIPLFQQELGMSGGLMVRQDWLDKFNLPMPQSIDDFLNVLRTFRNKDANGNGKKDEIPFCGSQGSLQVIGNLIGVQETFSMVGGSGGNVVFGPFEEEAYKTRLKLIKTMAQEQLINENYYNFDFAMRDTWISEDRIGAALTGLGNLDKWNVMMSAHPTFLMWPMDNPKQADGNRYFDRTDMSKSMRHDVTMISSKAANPAKCGELLNYFYTEEGHLLTTFGVQGVTYNMEEGNFPKYTDMILRNSDGLGVGDASAKYVGILGMRTFEDIRVWAQLSLNSPGARQANMRTWTDTFIEKTNTPVPPAMMVQADAEEFANIMADLKTYLLETIAKFTTGKLDIDKDYAKFVQTCRDLRAERALGLQDKAVKAWQARGGVPYKFTLSRAEIDWSKIPLLTQKGVDKMDPALK